MIVVRLHGGMGNQMFQYALGRALSLKYNTPLRLNTEAYSNKTPRPFKKNFSVRNYDLDIFNIKAEVAKRKEIPFIHRMYGNGKISLILDALGRRIFHHKGHEFNFKKFNSRILSIGENSYLDGFWQSYKYFENIKDVLYQEFTLKGIIPENVKLLSEEIKNTDSVCIHARRTDYLNNKFYNVLDTEYYNRALRELSDRVPIKKVYVFSDDLAWCREHLKFPVPVDFVGEEYVMTKGEGHMFLMNSCRHFIIANSTFSWWGAWLGKHDKKVVIAPKHWFKDKSMDTSDLIPSNWIQI